MWVSRPEISPVMVGRGAELGELRRLHRDLTDVRVALVSGEAGVGKSRLLREFATTLPGDTTVLSAAAQEGELNRPFDLLRDAVEPIVGGWSEVPEPLRQRAHALTHVLSPLLPLAAHDDDHEHVADELQRAAVELVAHLAASGPLVLVLEDLHWADAETVGLIGRLATTSDLPLLLVGTFRPEDFDRSHPLAALLGVLERQRAVAHLPLGRLARHELGVMLEAVYGRPASPETIVTLHQRTQGNPFFVEELVATAGDVPDDLVCASLPWNAAEAVLRRVDGLDADERAVVDTAAVLATRVPFDLLVDVVGVDEDRLIAVLQGLVHRGLLVEGDADTFSFRHALTREAVADQLLGRQRRRLHEKALTALRSGGETDDALLAHHAAGAGRHDEVVTHARAAAERFLREGFGLQTVRVAELGIASAEQLGAPDADELALRSLATRAALAVGLFDLAARHAELWRTLAVEAGCVPDEAAALRHLALPRFHAGDIPGYWALLDRALAVAEQLGPHEELGWCLAYRSQAFLFTDAFADAVEWADRALAVADEVGAPDVRTYALVNKGTALCSTRGSEDAGVALLEEAIEQARSANDYVSLGRAYGNAVLHYVQQDSWRNGYELAERGWRLTDSRGLGASSSNIAGQAVELALSEGNAEAAALWLSRARASGGPPSADPWLTALEGGLALAGGDFQTVREIVARLRADQAPGRHKASVYAADLAAELAAVTGDAAAAEGVLSELRPVADPGGDRHLVLTVAAHALEAGAPTEEVDAFLEAAVAASGHDDTCAWISHVEGLRAERRGDPAAAVGWYRAALDAPQSWRSATAIAGLHARLARCLEMVGDREGALTAAENGRDRLDHMPGPRRDELDELVRRLSVRAQGVGVLTPREAEVVELVAKGLTNRQIAERLYISTKTAAVHVSNILAKTGMSTRTEVAAWALRSEDREQGV